MCEGQWRFRSDAQFVGPAGRSDVDLVLSDTRMSDVDGFDLLRVLRHRFPSLPIILMSGLPVTTDDVVPAGATILTKPVDANDLQEAINAKLLPGDARASVQP